MSTSRLFNAKHRQLGSRLILFLVLVQIVNALHCTTVNTNDSSTQNDISIGRPRLVYEPSLTLSPFLTCRERHDTTHDSAVWCRKQFGLTSDIVVSEMSGGIQPKCIRRSRTSSPVITNYDDCKAGRNSRRTLSSGTLLAARRFGEFDDDIDELNEDKNIVVGFLESALDAVSIPVSFLPMMGSLPIVYPLVLLGAAAALPLPTSLLLDLFFAGYLYLGRSLNSSELDDDINECADDDCDDDEDSLPNLEGLSDFAALAGAIVSAGLVSPAGTDLGNGGVVALGGTGIGLAASSVISALIKQRDDEAEEEVSMESERNLDLWDRNFDGFLKKKENTKE